MTSLAFDKWDRRFIELAHHISSWSKDNSTKVGAVITDKKQRIVSLGFNGFARGVEDRDERLNNRELKYQIIIHSEINAIINAPRSVEGCTIYTWPFISCSQCTSTIINSGIKRIVAPDYFPERWKDSFELSLTLFKEARVQVYLVPLKHLSISPIKESYGNNSTN